MLREVMEAPCPFHVLCSTHLFHPAVSELSALIVNEGPSQQNVLLSSVSHSSKLMEPKDRGCWTHQYLAFYQKHR